MSNPHNIRIIADIPRAMAREQGDAPALIFGGRVMSHAELHERSNRCAQGLMAMGVKPGDRVAVMSKDSDDLFVLIFGIAKARAVYLGINWKLAAPEVRFILEDSESVVLFAGEDFHEMAAQLKPEIPRLREVVALTGRREGWKDFKTWCGAQSPVDPACGGGEDEVFAQMYTSGTTGNPKGVQLVNRSLFEVLRAYEERDGAPWIGWNSNDVGLGNFPSFHIAGLWWAISTLTAGGSYAVMAEWDPSEALRLIETEGVTKAFLVPAMIQMMLVDPACPKTDFSGFGPMIHGGAPMPQAILDRSVKVIPCEHIQIYGLTETGAMATCLREAEHREKPERRASVGRPCPGVRVRILDPDHQELGPRQIGEICIHSRANMLGYWKREDATRAMLVDGWIHTGDAGYVDEDGFVYICDRIKEMIIYAGENVFPAEVESVLGQHPAVSEAAVFGVPDDNWGELVRAVVVLHPGAEATPSQIQQFAREHLAGYKVPQTITFAPSLPRTASGKIQRGKLRAPFWEGRSRPI